MKVIALMGSPRKKDGFAVCNRIEEKLRDIIKTNLTFEYVWLIDSGLEDCRGCGLCFTKGEAFCPAGGESLALRDRIAAADGLVFVSPVYAYQVTAPFKRMVDRLAFLFHRPGLAGKPALVVATTDGGGGQEVLKYLGLTASGWGCTLEGSLEVIAPLFFERRGSASFFDPRYHAKALCRIERASASFAAALTSERPKNPSFHEIYLFHGLRSKTLTSALDRAYWDDKGWLTSQYYYPCYVSPIKRLFGIAIDTAVRAAWARYTKGQGIAAKPTA